MSMSGWSVDVNDGVSGRHEPRPDHGRLAADDWGRWECVGVRGWMDDLMACLPHERQQTARCTIR